jgi:hypothetical protein
MQLAPVELGQGAGPLLTLLAATQRTNLRHLYVCTYARYVEQCLRSRFGFDRVLWHAACLAGHHIQHHELVA